MIRKIIKINEELCNGCGLCADACHEGAIGMVNGKAKLLRDDYCDGLGNCLPVCEADAITFEEREAANFNEREVGKNRAAVADEIGAVGGELRQWPIQIKLVPVNAPYFDDANLLVAADCAAYAYGNFHADFMRGKITIIGCPKLDDIDYSEKLAEIIRQSDIRSVTVARMEVPCCGGIEHAVGAALKQSGKSIPWQTVTLTTDGEVLTARA